jgi:hypothetical protein
MIALVINALLRVLQNNRDASSVTAIPARNLHTSL